MCAARYPLAPPRRTGMLPAPRSPTLPPHPDKPTFLQSRPFLVWIAVVLTTWGVLAWQWLTPAFVAENCYYPLVMFVGAFVAGSTPQGGGAVAFPVLSVFLDVDRSLARDFSLMVQSIGMTSASVFLLSQPGALRRYRPLAWWLPTATAGFVFGMLLLQELRDQVVQGLFVGGMAAFALAYWRSDHRGVEHEVRMRRWLDRLLLGSVLFLGGIATSLFGTGVDVMMFTLLVTWFAMRERHATELTIVVMASLSVVGFVWRGLVENALTEYQVRTWLSAVPVVLIMAPVGTLVLTRISAEWLIRGIVVLNLMQLTWFNVHHPSWPKAALSLGVGAAAFGLCSWLMLRLARRRRAVVVAA